MMKPRNLLCLAQLLVVAACAPETPAEEDASTQALIARAAGFELDTEWEAPPGDPLEHAM